MSDFFQQGVISTLHILGDKGLDKIESELNEISRKVKTTILIPVLHSDYLRPQMKGILDTLAEIRYVYQVVLSLGRATKAEFAAVKNATRDHPLGITVFWLGNPKLRKLFRKLDKADLHLGLEGKGKSCWMAFGMILAQGETDIVALHDSDIKTYTREMVARLIYPVVNPNLTYSFSKGYYSRFTSKLHGRVTRLFTIPLFRSIETIIGPHPLIHYLNSFRYPLAGEFALDINLLRLMRFPGDWGLEVTTLYEIYRNIALKRICQVEIAHQYDHKHQSLSARDATTGLHKMVMDITVNVLKNLASEGVVLSEGVLKTIQKHYLKIAEDIIANYHAVAMINGLEFDRHEEETYVETFYQALINSCNHFLTDLVGPRMLPNWNRITSVYPDFLDDMREIVAADNR